MARFHARNLVRALVATALCTALAACAVAPIPDVLPALAFRQPGLYRLEVALLVFYGNLLIITPAFSGLAWGRLPTEISTRGARFAEETDRSTELDEAAIRKLEVITDELDQALTDAHIEIKRLSEKAISDNAQQGVDSKQ